MNSNESGLHLRAWRWFVPGLGFVLDGNYYYALKTPVLYFSCMEIQENVIQRGKALENAVSFLLNEHGSAPPPERTGEIQRNYLFFRNDGVSPLSIENERFHETRTYRQFGSDGSDIILLKDE